jgi:hypothetical protein
MHFHYLTQGVTANSIGVNPMVPTLTNDMYEQTSTMTVPVIQGGYTSLLLGVHQDATLSSSARKLHFDE